jgi:hypothetical protein
MKIYTEEQVRKMLEVCILSDKYPDMLTLNDVLKTQNHIELPSDEEIEKANPFVFGSKHLGTRDMDIWELGVTWMRNKIQGGNK